MCGYNLRNNPNGTCSECGLDFTSVPLARLDMIYADAKFERRFIRVAVLCVLIVMTPVAIGIVTLGSILMVVVGIAIFVGIVYACYRVDSETHRRHIKKSMTCFYDGTTVFGTYSVLVIAVLLIPAVILIAALLRGLFLYIV